METNFPLFAFIGFILLMVLLMVISYISSNSKKEIKHYKGRLDTCEGELRLHIKKMELLKADFERKLSTHSDDKKALIEKTELSKADYTHKLLTCSQANASLHKTIGILSQIQSNKSAIPYLAGIMADFNTIRIKMLAKQLDWGLSQERMKKVESLTVIRRTTKEMIEKAKVAEYQLAYVCNLYPVLEDILDVDFSELPNFNDLDTLSQERDNAIDFVSKDEWNSLSPTERNQRALDNYITSRKKTKWQVGRDYELYVGYIFEQKNYEVEYTGSYLRLEDMGRDLIAKQGNTTYLIQCKYWSKDKVIHEKHIFQLYGSLVLYKIENQDLISSFQGVIVTSTALSETARKAADFLGIKVTENYGIGEFPRIKCNIGLDEEGISTRIYHLPMDQQYDSAKLERSGSFKAFTVKEAEAADFRRAYKWIPK